MRKGKAKFKIKANLVKKRYVQKKNSGMDGGE